MRARFNYTSKGISQTTFVFAGSATKKTEVKNTVQEACQSCSTLMTCMFGDSARSQGVMYSNGNQTARWCGDNTTFCTLKAATSACLNNVGNGLLILCDELSNLNCMGGQDEMVHFLSKCCEGVVANQEIKSGKRCKDSQAASCVYVMMQEGKVADVLKFQYNCGLFQKVSMFITVPDGPDGMFFLLSFFYFLVNLFNILRFLFSFNLSFNNSLQFS